MASTIEFCIITRTSNRPLAFCRCQKSIDTQTYPKSLIKKFATFDHENDLDYVNECKDLIVLEMTYTEPTESEKYFYNDYLNEVLKYISETKDSINPDSWIIILNDDDMFSKSSSLEIIANHINKSSNPNNIYVWKCKIDGKSCPSDNTFRKKISTNDLHISSFAFHASKISSMVFDTTEKIGISDEVLKNFKVYWIDDILTLSPQLGNGKRKDIVPPPNKKLFFKNTYIPPIEETSELDDEEEILFETNENKMSYGNGIIKDLTPKKKICLKNTQDLPIETTQLEEEDLPIETTQLEEDEILSDNSSELSINDKLLKFAERADDENETDICLHNDSVNSINDENEEVVCCDGENKNTHEPNFSINLMCNDQIVSDTCTQETNDVLCRLVNLLNSGRKIYILDDNNMQKLSKCIFDSMTCIELEDKLVKVLETDMLEKKAHDIQTKISTIKSQMTQFPQIDQPVEQQIIKEPLQIQTRSEVISPLVEVKNTETNKETHICKIYVISDNLTSKNTTLERNRKLLSKCNIEYELVYSRDMGIYFYQNCIKKIIEDSISKSFGKIMILNGNDLLHAKFNDIFETQLSKIKMNYSLWFFGNTREIPVRDILSMNFEYKDYLFLYDDVKSAKLTTEEKAKAHWKSYGYREARCPSINIISGSHKHVNHSSGVVISSDVYPMMINLISKQNLRNCCNIFTEIQKQLPDSVIYSNPDLIIPSNLFGNGSSHQKLQQIGVKHGIYMGSYK